MFLQYTRVVKVFSATIHKAFDVASSCEVLALPIQAPSDMAPIKVGVLGYGFAAKSFHIPFIRAIPEYEIVAIVQRAEAPADPASALKGSHCTVDFPQVRHYRKVEDLFDNPEIDFVVVATHADTHISFAEQALQAGKHGRCCECGICNSTLR